MNRRSRSPSAPSRHRDSPSAAAGTLRIIGGTFGRRHLKYTGDPRTRPMKDRVREAVFNLVGPEVVGSHAIDLFAGTGALGLEALSRGAARATFLEQHFPTAAVIRENVATLGVTDIAQVHAANSFIWCKRLPDLGPSPWLVFCSPPYEFYVSRMNDLVAMLARIFEAAPLGSIFVVEADERCDFGQLPAPAEWDVANTRRPGSPFDGSEVVADFEAFRQDQIYQRVDMDIRNIDTVPAFITKDGSEIRELLAHRNSVINKQSLAEARLAPGLSTTAHYHPRTEEIYYIVAGTGAMRIDQETRTVTVGDAIAIPPGQTHQITNIGPEELRFLCCCAPGYEHEDTVLIEE